MVHNLRAHALDEPQYVLEIAIWSSFVNTASVVIHLHIDTPANSLSIMHV